MGPAVLTYPEDGAVADLSRPITWTTVQTQAYVLYLGSSVGASDTLNTNEILQNWFRVHKVPSGPRIYARLWTNVAGSWQYVDSSFFAMPMTYAISGTIYPRAIGAGARMVLSGAATQVAIADDQGRYTFSGLSPGT